MGSIMAKKTGSQDQDDGSQQTTQTKGGSDKKTLYIVVAAVAVIVIVALLYLYSTSSSALPVITQNRSQNTTVISMSPVQAEQMIGSLSYYNVSDIYNPLAPINISLMVAIEPQLYGNVTSGWATLASSANATTNASLSYIVMRSSNVSTLSQGLGMSLASYLNLTEVSSSSGSYNGMNYTYGYYSNSTTVAQLLYGWKRSQIFLVLLQGNPGFMANESTLINVTAADTP